MAACENGTENVVVTHVEAEVNKKLLKDFTGERTGFIHVGPKKFLFPVKFQTMANELRNFEVRPDDTWVVTFPRSGTTVTMELVWLLQNKLDIQAAKKTILDERFPFLEWNMMVHTDIWNEILADNTDSPENLKKLHVMGGLEPEWKAIAAAPSPRFIKTHLPLHLLPKKLLTSGAKVIYIARNPKDVAVSWYHLNCLARYQGFVGDFDKFWDYFEKDLTTWSPYWAHITEGWDNRNEANLLFLFYEDINKRLPDTIQKVSQFLKRTLNDDQLDLLVKHLKFQNFKNNPSVNSGFEVDLKILNSEEEEFVRKGKVGGWNDEFTPELSKRADKWIEENLSKTTLRFPS